MFTFCDIFSVVCDSRIHFMDHIPLLVYSQLVSMLHSGTVGLGFKSQPQRCRVTHTHPFNDPLLSGNSLVQTLDTCCASVHQAAKLVAVLLRVSRVTAGLVESNGSLPPGL